MVLRDYYLPYPDVINLEPGGPINSFHFWYTVFFLVESTVYCTVLFCFRSFFLFSSRAYSILHCTIVFQRFFFSSDSPFADIPYYLQYYSSSLYVIFSRPPALEKKKRSLCWRPGSKSCRRLYGIQPQTIPRSFLLHLWGAPDSSRY